MTDVLKDPSAWMGKPDQAEKPHVVFLLDESGSMSGQERAVISTFNEYVEKVKGDAATVSLYTFDSRGVRERFARKAPDNVRKMTAEDYVPCASTPLFDSMGDVIGRFREEAKVQFITHTDGMENCSLEWTKEALDKLIEELIEGGWLFTYLGESLSGANSLRNFKGLKLNFASAARGQAMDFLAGSTQTYSSTNSNNPETYTGSGDALSWDLDDEEK